MTWLKAFRAWMRVVLPFDVITALMVGLWILFNLLIGVTEFAMRSWGEPLRPEFMIGINASFAGLYGWHRAHTFHPYLKPDYFEWLKMQPWSADKPLPNGPVFFCWQDVVIVALCVMPVIAFGYSPALIVAAFLICFVVMWTWINWLTQEDLAVYLVAFSLPLVPVFRSSDLLVLCIVAFACGIAAWGIRRGFERFPCGPDSFKPGYRKLMAEKSHDANQLSDVPIGWPQRALLNEEALIGIGHLHAALVSVVAALVVLVIASTARNVMKPVDFYSTTPLLALVVAPVLAALRVFPYIGGTTAPIDFWGRLWTGRLIIPGYHYAFLAPMTILVFGTALHWALWRVVGLPLEWAIAIAVGINVWAMLALPPTVRNWRLTGHHRITEPSVRIGKFETL